MVTNPMPDRNKARLVLRLATRRSVVKRALLVSLIVGHVIGAINHGDKILAGVMAQGDWIKVALTFLVPYCVSSFSAVMAVLEQERVGQHLAKKTVGDAKSVAASGLPL